MPKLYQYNGTEWIEIAKNGLDGLDGKDADEQKIITEVIKRIPKPKDGSPDTGDQIVEKINKAKEKIDAKQIKNLPPTQILGGGGGDRVVAGNNITITTNGNGEKVIASTATGTGGGGAWGEITGDIANQTDLQTALNTKQDTLGTGVGLQIDSDTLNLDLANIDHNQLLNYDVNQHFAKSDINLDDLGNVSVANPANNEVLQFNEATGYWEANSLPGANHDLLSATHPDTVTASPVLGDIITGNSDSKWAKLSGNTTTTKKYLRQTGNGSASALPEWVAPDAADLTGTVNSDRLSGAYTGITGLGTLTGLTSGTILPSGTGKNIGGSGQEFENGYFNTIFAGTQVIANQVTGGDFTINAFNETNDALDGSLIFERGSASPNATVKWNSTTDKFNLNFPLDLGTNDLVTSGDVTDGTNATSPAEIKSAYDHSANTTSGHGLTFGDVVSVASPSAGGLVKRNAANTAWENLAIGTSGYVLTSNGTTPSWQPPQTGTGGTASAGPFLPKPDQRKFVALLANDSTPAPMGAAITVTAASKSAANDADDVWSSVSTSSTASNGACIRTTSTRICRLPHQPFFKGKIMTGSDITLQRLWVGLMSSASPVATSDTINGQGFAVRYSPTVSPNWFYVTRNATTQTEVDSGVVVEANTAYVFEASYSADTGAVTFTTNGIASQDISTTLPASNIDLCLQSWIFTNTTAVRTYKLSYLYATFVGSDVGISAGGGAPTDAYYVTTQANGDLTNDKLHPADGSGNVIHRFADLTDSLALTQIPDGSITEAKLDINNAPTDGKFLKWNNTAGKPEWADTSPADAQYLTLATNASLSNERVLTIGDGLLSNDGGANGNFTLQVRLDGTTLTKGAAGLKVTDGTYEPAITAGTTSQYWKGDKSWATLDKSAVGLGSVENTALSTWAGSANITTVGTVTSGNTTATVSAASDTVAGKVELATAAETTTGTDTGRAVTPDGLAGSIFGIKSCEIQLVADGTDVDTTSGVAYLNIPSSCNGMNLVRATAFVTTAGTTNATTVQVRNMTKYASNDSLSTAISIASGGTVATAGTVSTTYDDVSTDDLIKIYVTGQSTTKPKGLRVVLEFQLP